MDHFKITEKIEFEDNDADAIVLVYLSYSQKQATEDAGLTVGSIEFAIALDFLNYSLCLTTKDAEPFAG